MNLSYNDLYDLHFLEQRVFETGVDGGMATSDSINNLHAREKACGVFNLDYAGPFPRWAHPGPAPDAPLSVPDQKMEAKAREVAVWYHAAKRVFGSIQLVEGQMDEVKSRFYLFEQFSTDKQPDLERWRMAVDGAIAEHAAEREIRMREAVEFIRNTPGEIITSRVIPESHQARAGRELAQIQAAHHLAGGELVKMTAIMNKEGWHTHHPEDLTASPEASLKRFTPSERLAHAVQQIGAIITALRAERDTLKDWKEQAMTVESWWQKIDVYIRQEAKAPEFLGRDVSAIALEWVKLAPLLTAALDGSLRHHEYCGWGDSWEREGSEPLRRQIEETLAAAKKSGLPVQNL